MYALYALIRFRSRVFRAFLAPISHKGNCRAKSDCSEVLEIKRPVEIEWGEKIEWGESVESVDCSAKLATSLMNKAAALLR